MLCAKEIDSVEKEKLVMQKWGNSYGTVYMSRWEDKEFHAKVEELDTSSIVYPGYQKGRWCCKKMANWGVKAYKWKIYSWGLLFSLGNRKQDYQLRVRMEDECWKRWDGKCEPSMGQKMALGILGSTYTPQEHFGIQVFGKLLPEHSKCIWKPSE